MTLVPSTSPRALMAMQEIFSQVRSRLDELGLNLSVWDRGGHCIDPCKPAGEFCLHICKGSQPCQEACRHLSDWIIDQGQSGTSETSRGCCVVGVPILQRRRLLGAAVACFPTREMLDEEGLARTCSYLELDLKSIRQFAQRACRHSAAEAEDFLDVLDWLLTQGQDERTAREELATFSNNLSSTYEELSLLYRVSGSMRVTKTPTEFLREVCEQVGEVLCSSVGAFVRAHPPAIETDVSLAVGPGAPAGEDFAQLATEFVLSRFDAGEDAIVDNDAVRSGAPSWATNIVSVPLVYGAATHGVLVGFAKEDDFCSTDLKLLTSIASQSAVFLANHRLYADLEGLLMGVLHSLTSSIDAKDEYTCGHSRRVALLAQRIAELCELPPDQIERIYLTGLLHDVGKIGVPEAVLCKPGKLTDEEFEQIKKHPMIGARILGGIRQLDDVVPGILAHHERPDGRGYPHGLVGEEIPLSGRIVCLADCFDAMTSHRVYRKALATERVLAEIRDNSGTQFDPNLVDKFMRIDIDRLMEELDRPATTVLPMKVAQESV